MKCATSASNVHVSSFSQVQSHQIPQIRHFQGTSSQALSTPDVENPRKKKLAPVGMWHKRKQYGLVLKREGYLNFIHTYVNVYVYILHG